MQTAVIIAAALIWIGAHAAPQAHCGQPPPGGEPPRAVWECLNEDCSRYRYYDGCNTSTCQVGAFGSVCQSTLLACAGDVIAGQFLIPANATSPTDWVPIGGQLAASVTTPQTRILTRPSSARIDEDGDVTIEPPEQERDTRERPSEGQPDARRQSEPPTVGPTGVLGRSLVFR